jgi:pimeloyl-ACP methyl ester carboxylesterase
MANGKLYGNIWVEEEGRDGPDTLILIHGLGANGAAWDRLVPLINKDWNGLCIVPDLRGHGRSLSTECYSFGTFAADIADAVLSYSLPADSRIAIIGHSLGGALGALLASGWFGLKVETVLALSVKTQWSTEELSKFQAISCQPVRYLDSEDEIRTRFVRSSGLSGIVSPSDRIVDLGIINEPGCGFRFAADPRVIGSTGPQLDKLLTSAMVPVHFVAGRHDTLAPAAGMQPYDPETRVIEGAGHNVHLEAPNAIWQRFLELKQRYQEGAPTK